MLDKICGITAILLISSCSAFVDETFFIQVPQDENEWVSVATNLSADFWLDHGPLIAVSDQPSPLSVITKEMPPDRIAECDCLVGAMRGTIHLDPDLGTSVHHNDETRRCVVAHEIGHAFGMNHVDEPGSLMNPVVSYDTGDECWWSESDQEEFCEVQPKYCE